MAAHAAGPRDPRGKLISQQELQQKVKQVPINSPVHMQLLSRARSSQLADSAYHLYTQIQQQHPDDAYSNLLAGMAAKDDWEYQTAPSVSKLMPYSLEARAMLGQANTFLRRAVELQPDLPKANLEYGYFLWKHSYSLNTGLAPALSVNTGFALILKSVKLAPKDPTGHTLLGEVYSNPFGPYKKTYNPVLAETELRTAVALDASYAYPHLSLVFLYNDTKRYKEARSQMDEFLSLSPPDAAKDKVVQVLQAAINKGIGR